MAQNPYYKDGYRVGFFDGEHNLTTQVDKTPTGARISKFADASAAGGPPFTDREVLSSAEKKSLEAWAVGYLTGHAAGYEEFLDDVLDSAAEDIKAGRPYDTEPIELSTEQIEAYKTYLGKRELNKTDIENLKEIVRTKMRRENRPRK